VIPEAECTIGNREEPKKSSCSGAASAITFGSPDENGNRSDGKHTEITLGVDMASTIQQAKITGYATFLPTVVPVLPEVYEAVYQENRHRLYAMAFWMTDNELSAEELMRNSFLRAFAGNAQPTAEMLDRALIAEVRELMPLGALTLDEGICTEAPSIRRNILRVHLERAVVQLPATERMIFLMHDVENYSHERIARFIGLNEDESVQGLHQARLHLRNLLAEMMK
jgi:RNA polymerase sigma-70 factor (ECF subfamily)